MDIKHICTVYFSPTGNVKRIAEVLASRIIEKTGTGPAAVYDFTLPAGRKEDLIFGEGDLVIFGTPVYAGRVPNVLLPFLNEHIKGSGAIAIPFVSFGGRSYDNALTELFHLLAEHGFTVAGSCAVSSEHAFPDTIGAGHPDEADISRLCSFADGVLAAVTEAAAFSEIKAAEPEGIYPPPGYYRPLKADGTPAVFLKATSKADMSLCTRCMKCAAVCPMGSIDASEPDVMHGICIKCQACIHVCPAGARYFDNPDFLSHQEMLRQNYSSTAPSAYFI